jgi:hypothetical protein
MAVSSKTVVIFCVTKVLTEILEPDKQCFLRLYFMDVSTNSVWNIADMSNITM